MQLSLQQAALRLGKSVRQVRYLIQTGGLAARKSGGRWLIDAANLTLSEPQKAAVARRERALRGAVEAGLGLDEGTPERYSVLDCKSARNRDPGQKPANALNTFAESAPRGGLDRRRSGPHPE